MKTRSIYHAINYYSQIVVLTFEENIFSDNLYFIRL